MGSCSERAVSRLRLARLLCGAGDTYLIVANDVEQSDDVRTAAEVLQDLDLALYLLLLDRLQNLDDALLVVDDVDALEDLGVFAASWIWASASARGAGTGG